LRRYNLLLANPAVVREGEQHGSGAAVAAGGRGSWGRAELAAAVAAAGGAGEAGGAGRWRNERPRRVVKITDFGLSNFHKADMGRAWQPSLATSTNAT